MVSLLGEEGDLSELFYWYESRNPHFFEHLKTNVSSDKTLDVTFDTHPATEE